ncbi:DUF1254 domain-containing protein [Lamprocystis purpurea]|jgi:hypothetical protein|uniref:DUF1254 domain-containing protein n=1 Tax=Lamprocystis purpurea TaxID=61598 RepID=UPI000360560B|nr:DUF1254 domain-containing protein [Lamprocystis purpurea]
MQKPRLGAGVACALALSLAGGAVAQEPPLIESYRLDLGPAQIAQAHAWTTRAIASQAYLIGLPAFMNLAQLASYRAARLMIAPQEEPFGGWLLVRDFSTPRTTTVMPNVDTLYGAAFLRLDRQGPVVLSLPAVRDRYLSVAILDAYFSNVAVLGPRTIGQIAANILIAPPGWDEATPEGIDQVVVVPTPVATLFQRVRARNEADLAAARSVQDTIRLAPLDRWRGPDRSFPRIETSAVDGEALHRLRDPLRFFEVVSDYTALNPPPPPYRALSAMSNAVGLGPGGRLPEDPALREAITAGARDAQLAINAVASYGPFREGWRVPDPQTGRLGLDPLRHAATQVTQVGSLPADEAMYFVAVRDAQDRPLEGRRSYTLTFPAGQLPPVGQGGFWSLTMYRASDGRLVENPLGRYLVGPETPGLAPARDGSLTVTFAAERPAGVPEGNWLPAPRDAFLVTLRTYLPEIAIRDGLWFPPAVRRID